MTPHDRYPLPVVAVALAQMLAGIVLGAMLFARLVPWLGLAYVALNIATFVVCMRLRCRFCCYFGKRCYSGLGLLAPLLGTRGKGADFRRPANLVPAAVASFGTMLLPIVAAIILLVRGVPGTVLLLAGYILLSVVPSFFLRSRLFCGRCRQGKLGCPALEGMRGK